MLVLDYDRSEKRCPKCKEQRLIFIIAAPALWPEGQTIQYRCKPCAVAESDAAGDPITVPVHREKRSLPNAWKSETAGARYRSALRYLDAGEDHDFTPGKTEVVGKTSAHYCDECRKDVAGFVLECRREYGRSGKFSWHYLCERHADEALHPKALPHAGSSTVQALQPPKRLQTRPTLKIA